MSLAILVVKRLRMFGMIQALDDSHPGKHLPSGPTSYMIGN